MKGVITSTKNLSKLEVEKKEFLDSFMSTSDYQKSYNLLINLSKYVKHLSIEEIESIFDKLTDHAYGYGLLHNNQTREIVNDLFENNKRDIKPEVRNKVEILFEDHKQKLQENGDFT